MQRRMWALQERGVYADAFLVVHIRKMYSSPIVTQYHSTVKMNDMYEKKKKKFIIFYTIGSTFTDYYFSCTKFLLIQKHKTSVCLARDQNLH